MNLKIKGNALSSASLSQEELRVTVIEPGVTESWFGPLQTA